MTRRLFIALSLMLALLAGPPMAGTSVAQPQTGLPVSDLVIHAASGAKKFKVELADTDAARSKGMMFRTHMAPDAGMLFDFITEQPASFWMRNTLIPLDMLFIKADGTILNIHQRAIPQDETSISSAGPVRAVLELNGGTSARLGLKAGDRVDHAIFGRKP